MSAILKFHYIRSKKLMEMYRTIPCQNCFIDNGTVCGCHSNQSKHGKGGAIKASDEFAASMCNGCHSLLDSEKTLTRLARETMWNKAYARTVHALLDKFGDVYLMIVNQSRLAA